MKGRFLTALAALAFFIMPLATADEVAAPRGVLVKVDPATKTVEVFKADKLSKDIIDHTATDSATVAAIESIEKPANKVAEFRLKKSELDADSSTDAWGYRWYNRGWNWNYWGGYRPYYYNWYRPYYYPGYFNYGYNYGYNNYGYNNYYYNWGYPYNNYYYGWYYY